MCLFDFLRRYHHDTSKMAATELNRPMLFLRSVIISSCCSHCLTINESDCFTSSTTSCVHKIRQNLSCISTDVIYLITCKKCEAQYVG